MNSLKRESSEFLWDWKIRAVPLSISELSIGNHPLADVVGTEIQQLSAPQVAAMEVLMAGGTLTSAAQSAGVSRQAIYKWLKSDPQFATAYQSWKRGMAEMARTRLLMMTNSATNVLNKAIRGGDAKLALKLLQGLGLLSAPAVGPSLLELKAVKEDADGRIKQGKAIRAERTARSDKEFHDILGLG